MSVCWARSPLTAHPLPPASYLSPDPSYLCFRDLPEQAPLWFLADGAPRPAGGGGGHPQQRARAARTHGAGPEHGADPDVRRARDGDVRPERAGLALSEWAGRDGAEGIRADRPSRRLLADPLAGGAAPG